MNLLPRNLTPDLELETLADLELSFLEERGICLLVCDADNALGPYHCTGVHAILKPKLKELLNRFDACILSNTAPERKITLSNFFGIEVALTDHKKPDIRAYRDIEHQYGVAPQEAAMIGDRLITDIAGANRAGWYSIKVKAFDLRSEPSPVTLARAAETFVLRTYRE